MNALQIYRLQKGMTYQELAKLSGMSSKSSVFHHCLGKRKISAESAMKYHKALNIPLSQLRPDLWQDEKTLGDS